MNVSAEVSSVCELALTYQKSWSTCLNSIGNVISCVCAITILMFATYKRKYRSFPCHLNFKIIIINIWCVVFMYLTTTIIAYCFDLVLQQTAKPCENTYVFWRCLLLRWPIALERTVATRLLKQYEISCKFLGPVIVATTWTIVLSLFYFAYRVDDYYAILPACSVTVAVNELRIRRMAYFMLSANIIVAGGGVYLWLVNRSTIRKKVYCHYSLSISYQMSENYFTSVLVLPISIAHSLLYTTYLTAAQIIRHIVSAETAPILHVSALTLAHQIIYLDIVVCLLLYICTSKRMEEEKKFCEIKMKNSIRADIYFNMLRKQLE